MATLTADEIMARLDRETPQPVSGNVHTRVVLEEKDTAWDPTSTKHMLRGPARVLYTRFADGAVEAAVR